MKASRKRRGWIRGWGASLGLALGLLGSALACGGGGHGDPSPAQGAAPSITTQPQAATVAAGATGTFSVMASGSAPLAYQWRRHGNPIAGAQAASYTTPPTVASDDGARFSVVVSNGTGSTTSAEATLTVTASAGPPSNLHYAQASISGIVGIPITPDLPTVTGTVEEYTISPALPANLTLNAATGALSGTPAVASGLTTYTVTARNGSGSTTTTVQIAVAPSGASGNVIPLQLGAAPEATSIPVRSGIPFPSGALGSLTNLRLETGDGSQEVPAQFDTLATWPNGSLKAVLVQFVADVGASRGYRLVYGSGVTRTPASSALKVSQAGGNTTVTTGPLRFILNAKGLLTSLWRDANHDGTFDPAEQVLGAGEFFMVNAFDGLEYTASQAVAPEITLEEQGPIRAVIRARGALTSAGGTALIKYLVRYSAYAGSDKLDLEFSVIDDRVEENVEPSPAPRTLAFAAKGYGLRWAYLSDGPAQYRFGLDKGGSASGTVNAEHYLLQNGAFIFDNGEDQGHTFSYSGVGTGLRAPGWVALDSGARHLALMVRDFWQQYPVELNVKANTLTAALFAERALGGPADTTLPTQSGTRYRRPNSFYFTRPGAAKTHQLRFAFGEAAPSSAAVAQLNGGFQRHRLELVASPAWYAASGVFGDLNVGDPTASTGYSAMLLQDVYVPSLEQPTPESVTRHDPDDLGGDATVFGWRDYGDRLRAGWNDVVNGVRIPSFYNDTHIGANGFLHEFVRTGEQRWFQLGEVSTRHFADLDVSHGPRKGYWDGAYAMGQQPAGEIHAQGHANEDHQVRNMHWGHAHVSGLSDLYLLTGDKRSLEVLTEIANWWKFVAPHFFQTPFDKNEYREAERDYGWPLYVMNEYVRVTGDATYHKDVGGQLVNHLIQWWQTPLNHIGYNPATDTVSSAVVNVNDASKGTGYWTMTLMDNSNGVAGATGCNPWMAGPLISNLITYYEQDKVLAASGKGSGISHATLEDMLFQTMNYVVKYGYDTRRHWFVYSETTRDDTGGHTLLDHPLAYLDRLYKQRLAASAVPHPAWYDTQASWLPIAKGYYDELTTSPVGANTQSYGFYGYEMVFPVDFFKIMSPP